MTTTLRIRPPSLDDVVRELAAGQRRRAAQSARAVAQYADADALRTLAAILADAVEQAGDIRPNRRPTKTEAAQYAVERGELLRLLEPDLKRVGAIRDLREMLIARDLADKKRVGPKTLAQMMMLSGHGFDDEPDLPYPALDDWREARLSDPAAAEAAREFLRAYAVAVLKRRRLNRVPRAGGPSEFRRRIAEAHGVALSLLKGVTVKTSE